jgi:uncharacterized protein (DUF2236 family)
VTTPIVLPWPLQSSLEAATRVLFESVDHPSVDFSQPAGGTALVSPNSVSWRVFKNPLSLFIGGVTAVIMELAEPRVRTGVWEHTSFRVDPIRRLRRIGFAAMVTIYGARSTAEAMIAGVRRLERSDIVFEFLAIMRSTPTLPLPLRPFQHLLVRAAIDLTPRWLRTILRLDELGLRAWETAVVRQAAAFVDRIVLETNPAVQACRRMRLPADYLYPHNSATEAI